MHEPPDAATPPTIVEQGYAAWLWIDARVADFPALARRHVGHRLLDAVLDTLATTVEATYTPRGGERAALLTRSNRSLTLARILLRGARDRRYLSVAQHEHAMRLIDDWGRQLGGWLRAKDPAARAARGPGRTWTGERESEQESTAGHAGGDPERNCPHPHAVVAIRACPSPKGRGTDWLSDVRGWRSGCGRARSACRGGSRRWRA